MSVFEFLTLKVGYTNGLVQYFQLSDEESERLKRVLSEPTNSTRYLLFDSESYNVCLSMEHVLLLQFLEDIYGQHDPGKVFSDRVTIFFHNQPQPVYFSCDADTHSMEEGQHFNDNQFQHLLFTWDSFDGVDFPYLRFFDTDNEEVILNRKHVAVILIPKALADPELTTPDDLSDAEFEALMPDEASYEQGDGHFSSIKSDWSG